MYMYNLGADIVNVGDAGWEGSGLLCLCLPNLMNKCLDSLNKLVTRKTLSLASFLNIST